MVYEDRNCIAVTLIGIATYSFAQKEKPFFSSMMSSDYSMSRTCVSPDGKTVVYRRMQIDIEKDAATGNLWQVLMGLDMKSSLFTMVMNSGLPGLLLEIELPLSERAIERNLSVLDGKRQNSPIDTIGSIPSSLSWSPDGKSIAFQMKVLSDPPELIEMPEKPKGSWADAARVTDRLYHESDGNGYIDPGFTHLLIDAEGSAAQQLTQGDFQHRGPISWHPSEGKIYFTSNINEDWEHDFRNSEVYELSLASGSIKPLTNRKGPDAMAKISPDGKYIAYLGYEDRVQAYQNKQLWIMDTTGNNHQLLSGAIDASISQLEWSSNSSGLYISYDQQGDTKIAFLDLKGSVEQLAAHLGGTSIGRPYGGGSFSVSEKGEIAYTFSTPYAPAELALLKINRSNQSQNLMRLF